MVAGGFSSEEMEARRGLKKKERERESETVFDRVAFSLSRLFRNEYRQWPTQRQFFSSRLERRGRGFPSTSILSSPAPPPLLQLRPVTSLPRLSVTETRLQSVNIIRHRFLPSCFLGTEFRYRLDTKHKDFRWSRDPSGVYKLTN